MKSELLHTEETGYEPLLTPRTKSTRKQLDELTKRVQGLTALEGRVAKLEKQVAALTKKSPKRSPARKAPPTAAP